MRPQPSILLAWLLLFAAPAFSQQLNQLIFSEGRSLSSLGFTTDQRAIIRVSEDGRVLEWGTEVKALNYDIYAPKLQPFPGRIEYYGAEGDSVSKGRVKSIGTCVITYYGAYEPAEKIGKIKSIGSLAIDYFSPYENASLKGKIKQVGSLALDYYGPFENDAFKGKLKQLGNNSISYHSSFDDKAIRGKIKSVGSFTFSWYTSLDPGRVGGALKSGSYRQTINGVTYILQ